MITRKVEIFVSTSESELATYINEFLNTIAGHSIIDIKFSTHSDISGYDNYSALIIYTV